jgi:hypothetical protein
VNKNFLPSASKLLFLSLSVVSFCTKIGYILACKYDQRALIHSCGTKINRNEKVKRKKNIMQTIV